MIYWLRERPIRSGVRLRVGGYLPPFRARVFLMSLALITVLIGMGLCSVLLFRDAAILPRYESTGLPGWSYYFLCLVLLCLPAPFVATPFGQIMGEILIGSRFTVIITKEYVQAIRWLVYRPKYPVGPGIAFERLPHPKAAEEIIGNQLRKAKFPKNPARAMEFDQYQKAGVVVLRQGSRVIRLASIYDRKPPGLGHKADRLVHTLQRIHGECQTGNRSAAAEKTPEQYGSRPSLA